MATQAATTGSIEVGTTTTANGGQYAAAAVPVLTRTSPAAWWSSC